MIREIISPTNRRVAHIASGDFLGPRFQRFFVDPDMKPAPDPTPGDAMLAHLTDLNAPLP